MYTYAHVSIQAKKKKKLHVRSTRVEVCYLSSAIPIFHGNYTVPSSLYLKLSNLFWRFKRNRKDNNYCLTDYWVVLADQT